MTAENLTVLLAERVMHWSVAPDRFLMGGRRWVPRWRFAPFKSLENAFQLLERAASTYSLTKTPNGIFSAQVCVAGSTGTASGKSEARTITVAVARAIGLDVPDSLLEAKKR